MVGQCLSRKEKVMSETKVSATAKVADIMSRDVVTIYASDSLHDALKLLVENHVSALPVVNGAGLCLGILSAVAQRGQSCHCGI